VEGERPEPQAAKVYPMENRRSMSIGEGGVAKDDLAIVLSGGGARAAYQVGVLRGVARLAPHVRFPIVTGVSAGAINAAFLAALDGPLEAVMERLTELWTGLRAEDVFRVDPWSLSRSVFRWGVRLSSGGLPGTPRIRGLVDTAPLRTYLARAYGCVDGEIPGVARQIESGALRSLAITTLSYSTGQTITWVQGDGFEEWRLPMRRSTRTRITVDHVMASAALPIFFPAVRLGKRWYGDGGVRLASPLSPPLHLGANRVFAVSTRYARSQEEADTPTIEGYPPPAQVLGNLMNSIFLDVLDQDARRLERVNALLRKVPPELHGELRPVKLLVVRPSEDLGKLAGHYELRLPRGFRFLIRGLGTRETKSPDFLSLLMFQPDYLRRLIEIGERDAEARQGAIEEFFA
jgi:NTE family protein